MVFFFQEKQKQTNALKERGFGASCRHLSTSVIQRKVILYPQGKENLGGVNPIYYVNTFFTQEKTKGHQKPHLAYLQNSVLVISSGPMVLQTPGDFRHN